MLPSATVGTIEPSSLTEPIHRLLLHRNLKQLPFNNNNNNDNNNNDNDNDDNGNDNLNVENNLNNNNINNINNNINIENNLNQNINENNNLNNNLTTLNTNFYNNNKNNNKNNKIIIENNFYEGSAIEINQEKNEIKCINEDTKQPFSVQFDYLILAMGSENNTFNTEGVVDHCYFIKNINDARSIRSSILQRFEFANLPSVSSQQKVRFFILFVIIYLFF